MDILPQEDLRECSFLWVLKGVWQSRLLATGNTIFRYPKLMLWGSYFMTDPLILSKAHGLSSRIVMQVLQYISSVAEWVLLFIQCSGKTAGEPLVLVVSVRSLGKIQ